MNVIARNLAICGAAVTLVAIFSSAAIVQLGRPISPLEARDGEDLTAEECRSAGCLCIRVHNSTGIDFHRFEVYFTERSEDFGALRDAETSAYRRIDRAYGYAYTDAFSGDGWFVLQPIDYVGEPPLPAGTYTYDYHSATRSEPLQVEDRLLYGYLSSTLEVDEVSGQDIASTLIREDR